MVPIYPIKCFTYNVLFTFITIPRDDDDGSGADDSDGDDSHFRQRI